MNFTITSITLDGLQAFAVGGTTELAGKQVRCQAFVGGAAASSEQTTTSDPSRHWALQLPLNNPFNSSQTYRVIAVTEDEDGTEANVPPFFNSAGGIAPPGPTMTGTVVTG